MMRRGAQRRAVVVASAVLLALVGAIVGAIVVGNGGSFAYALDDPYIHLELARAIGLGEHGLNADEFSAPSSSILWPLLLVPAWWLPGTVLAPLGLALLAALLAVPAAARVVARALGPDHPRAVVAFTVAFVGVANLPALVVAGMEHVAHVAAAAWAAAGLVAVDEDERVPPWLVPALVAGPLLRFEGLGLALVAGAWLAWRGHRAAGAAAAVLSSMVVAGYLAWVHARTGHWLPFSILSKRAMFPPAWQQLWMPAILLPTLLAVGVVAATRRGAARGRELPALALAAVAGHVALGQVGLLGRYVAYLSAFVSLVAVASLRPVLRDRLAAGGESARIVGWCVALFLVAPVQAVGQSVGAGLHVWRLQGQMRRLADAVGGPVAVNDVGWVSYGTDRYVVDLAGLSSQEAIDRIAAGDLGPGWMEALVARHGAGLVMVFPDWFDAIPAAWTPLGTLATRWSGFPDELCSVRLYAARPDDAGRLTDALRAFRTTLPTGAEIVLVGEPDEAP